MLPYPDQAHSKWVSQVSFLGVKLLVHEADCTSPSDVEVKSEQILTSALIVHVGLLGTVLSTLII